MLYKDKQCNRSSTTHENKWSEVHKKLIVINIRRDEHIRNNLRSDSPGYLFEIDEKTASISELTS